MASESPALKEQQTVALRELAELRSFTGPPKEFWPRYLGALAAVTSASKAILLVQDSAGLSTWKRLGEWSDNLGGSRFLAVFHSQLDSFATDCAKHGEHLITLLEPGISRGAGHYVIAAALKLQGGAEFSVVVLLLSEFSDAAARESLVRLKLAIDVPESYRLQQAVEQATGNVQKLATALDLMVTANLEKRFLATALAFCNGMATHFCCQRVSLGWLEGGYLRLRAISRTEKFDRKMAAVQALEAAMDEALDQDEEILWPVREGASVVTRDHDRFAKGLDPGNLCSLPLRVDSTPVAVVMCERRETPFTAAEVEQLRLCCDQVSRRLA